MDDVDSLIKKLDAEIEALLEQAHNKKLARDHLVEAKRIQSGDVKKTLNGKRKYKLPTALKDILMKANKPLHADQITVAVNRLGFYKSNKQAVTSVLTRWNAQGKYVRRTAPNTYELLEKENDKSK